MLRLSVVTLSTSTLVAVSGLVFPSTFPRRLRPASATHRTSPPGGSGDNLSAPDTLDGEACDPLDAFPPPECTDSPGLDTWVRADDESVCYLKKDQPLPILASTCCAYSIDKKMALQRTNTREISC